MFSPWTASRRRRRRFPFHVQVGMSPLPLPDCHLVRTAFLCRPNPDSLGDFHSRPVRFLSSFASSLSRKYRICRKAMRETRVAFLSRSAHARQATLHTAFTARSRVAPHCRFISGIVHRSHTAMGVRRCTISGLHSDRVTVLYAIRACPSAAGVGTPSPSIHPKLGVRSRHHGIHSCALQRIFRPFLEIGRAD